jgi:hypothetical protein
VDWAWGSDTREVDGVRVMEPERGMGWWNGTRKVDWAWVKKTGRWIGRGEVILGRWIECG